MCIKGCPVPIYQSEWELSRLVDIYRELKPRRVLEIGSMFGGTLWYWIQNAPGAVIVSVDLPVQSFDWRHEDVQAGRKLWPVWANTNDVVLHTIEADSTDPATVAKAKAHGPYDFIFIDGDHRAPAAFLDFENYFSMLREGGACALHDIAYPDDNRDRYVTGQLWQRIKVTHEHTQEIIRDDPGGIWGIGVVWNES